MQIKDQRTQNRNEGIEHIKARDEELKQTSNELSDRKSDYTKEDFNQKNRDVELKRNKLSELRTTLEQTPDGVNADLSITDKPAFENTARR